LGLQWAIHGDLHPESFGPRECLQARGFQSLRRPQFGPQISFTPARARIATASFEPHARCARPASFVFHADGDAASPPCCRVGEARHHQESHNAVFCVSFPCSRQNRERAGNRGQKMRSCGRIKDLQKGRLVWISRGRSVVAAVKLKLGARLWSGSCLLSIRSYGRVAGHYMRGERWPHVAATALVTRFKGLGIRIPRPIGRIAPVRRVAVT